MTALEYLRKIKECPDELTRGDLMDAIQDAEQMENDQLLLDSLRYAGVDNWSHWEFAVETYNAWKGEEV